MPNLSVRELLNLVYGDDALTQERAWLIRNTYADGHCKVIPAILASHILKEDEQELLTHIEVYTASADVKVYTLWSKQEWDNSDEKRRLLIRSLKPIYEKRDNVLLCESLVNDAICVLRKALDLNADTCHSMSSAMLTRAASNDYNVEQLRRYLQDLNKNFPHLKLVTQNNNG